MKVVKTTDINKVSRLINKGWELLTAGNCQFLDMVPTKIMYTLVK